MLAEIQVTSQMLFGIFVWQKRATSAVSKFQASIASRNIAGEIVVAKKMPRAAMAGRGKTSSQGGEKVTRPIQSMGRRHDAFSFSDAAPKAACVATRTRPAALAPPADVRSGRLG